MFCEVVAEGRESVGGRLEPGGDEYNSLSSKHEIKCLISIFKYSTSVCTTENEKKSTIS